MSTVEISRDTWRLLEAIADVERAERRLAVELATFHAVHDKIHPDDVPPGMRAAAFAAHAVLDRAKSKQNRD